MATSVRDRWERREVETAAGRLVYVVLPGPSPFVGCTSLDGRPVAPVEARRLLVDLGHDDGALGCIGGDDWVEALGPRRPM